MFWVCRSRGFAPTKHARGENSEGSDGFQLFQTSWSSGSPKKRPSQRACVRFCCACLALFYVKKWGQQPGSFQKMWKLCDYVVGMSTCVTCFSCDEPWETDAAMRTCWLSKCQGWPEYTQNKTCWWINQPAAIVHINTMTCTRNASG